MRYCTPSTALAHNLAPTAAVWLLTITALSNSASAHHGMDGALPATWTEGFVSGLAHPVIGLDHLTFVISISLLAAIAGRSIVISLAFVAATLVGASLDLAGFELPFAGPAVLLTLPAAAVALFTSRSSSRVVTVLAATGVLHGYAYAESIIGAEPAPLSAYLLGFSLVQFAIALTTAFAFRLLMKSAGDAQTVVRRTRNAAGAIVAASAMILFAGQFATS